MVAPRILLVVGGGIAAYKSCELVRLIKKGGGEVTCVLTEGGSQFVTPMSLAALSGNKVHSSLWDLKDEAEIVGDAGDLGTTLILATDKPVLAVPAMNVRMWEHATTQRNIERLRDAGVRVMQPEEGEMACGEFGAGRLPEPEMVWLEIADALGLDPGEAGVAEIATFIEALEPEDETQPGADGGKGGLAGLLSSIIPRSTARRIREEEVAYSEEDFAAIPPEELPEAGPPLPEPVVTEGPVLAKKGKAKSAPPTDREAINHEVDPTRAVPEPVAIEPPTEPTVPAFAPLEGQPDFEGAP